jgi:hypothetical protein
MSGPDGGDEVVDFCQYDCGIRICCNTVRCTVPIIDIDLTYSRHALGIT